jgi:hypothetical protein
MRLRQFYCRRSAVEQTAPRPNILESNRLRYFSVSTGIQAGEAAHKLKSNMKLPRLSTSTDPRGFHGSISTGSERRLYDTPYFQGMRDHTTIRARPALEYSPSMISVRALTVRSLASWHWHTSSRKSPIIVSARKRDDCGRSAGDDQSCHALRRSHVGNFGVADTRPQPCGARRVRIFGRSRADNNRALSLV